jgi:hypothetical protein
MIRRIAPLLLLALVIWPPAVHAADDAVYFSIEYKRPVNVFDYFPLQVGSIWTYEDTHETSIRTVPERKTIEESCPPTEYCGPKLIKRSTIEIRVTGRYDVPEGTVVVREVREKDVHFEYPPDADPEEIDKLGNGEKPHTEPYLIKGNYVFRIPDWGWDRERRDLTPRFREQLKDWTPEFFFPMDKVGLWAERSREERDFRQGELFDQGKGPAPNPGMYYWVVENNSRPVQVPYGELTGVFFLMYRTTGGPTMVWFKNGLGVVKTLSIHSGSYMDHSSELKAFHPAGR